MGERGVGLVLFKHDVADGTGDKQILRAGKDRGFVAFHINFYQRGGRNWHPIYAAGCDRDALRARAESGYSAVLIVSGRVAQKGFTVAVGKGDGLDLNGRNGEMFPSFDVGAQRGEDARVGFEGEHAAGMARGKSQNQGHVADIRVVGQFEN